MKHHHAEAIAALADLSPQELADLHAAHRNRQLRDAERAKAHPLSTFSLPEEEFAALRAHILDGGGVIDDRELAQTLMQALFDGDQATFWRDLPHFLKCRAKIHGHMRALASGGVSLPGIGLGGKK